MLFNRSNGLAVTPFGALSRELDRMFEGFVDHPAATRSFPPVTVWETESGFEIEAGLAGVRSEDLEVSVHGKRVTLRGERPETKREDATEVRREWGAYKFERSFDLPTDIDNKGVVAELKDGVLRLTLPKAPGHVPQKIKVLEAK